MADHVIETSTGPVAGETKYGVHRWKGIPYGAPPVGELRFAPPERPDPWTTPRDATGRFPICPQLLGGLEAAAGGAGADQSEAGCLTLNVWSPAADDARRPTMFWIHGGGFQTGAGTIPWYDGSSLANRGVVVVTINYRLGPLGFLHLPDVPGSGNAGILDQIAALEWVRDNIAAFGGDPDNVTIFGESAGGMSVGTLLGTPSVKGLFHRAIPQSGAAEMVASADAATQTTEQVMAAAGVDDVAGLRALSVDEFLAATKVLREDFTGRGLPWSPVVDGAVLPRPPDEAIADGSAAGIDLLAGWNAEEFRLFAILDPRLQSVGRDKLERAVARRAGAIDPASVVDAYEAEFGPERLCEALLTDLTFRLPAIALLDAQSPHAPTFGYEFRFDSAGFGGSLGAGHAVEIPFVFDNLDRKGVDFLTGPVDDSMRSLAGAMADAWVSFATSGSPAAAGLPDWPTYDASRSTMILDIESGVESDPGGVLRQLWTSGGPLGP